MENVNIQLFHYGGPYHIKTKPLLCRAKKMERFLYDRDLHRERVKGVRRANLDFYIPTIKRRINCEISKMQRILLKINYQD